MKTTIIVLSLVLTFGCGKKATEDGGIESAPANPSKTEKQDENQKTQYHWKGTVSSILNSLLMASAHADDSICVSKCNQQRCAILVEHRSSQEEVEICRTNADKEFKFDFVVEPNQYFHNKFIEIKIQDLSDPTFERSFIEVVDKNNRSVAKAISPTSTLTTICLKDKIKQSIDNQVHLIQFFQEEVSFYSPDKIFETINQTYNLNLDSNNLEDLVSSIHHLKQIDLEVIEEKIDDQKNEHIGNEIFAKFNKLCLENDLNIYSSQTESNLPSCYIHLKSLYQNELIFWDYKQEMKEDCFIYQNQKYCTEEEKYKIANLLTPSHIDQYIKVEKETIEKIESIMKSAQEVQVVLEDTLSLSTNIREVRMK